MIIDSPIISGSYAASGSLNQLGNVIISGSLTITGGITGSISGSANSASYAATASYVNTLSQKLLPSANGTYDLGSSSLYWGDAYLDYVYADSGVRIASGNAVSWGSNDYIDLVPVNTAPFFNRFQVILNGSSSLVMNTLGSTFLNRVTAPSFTGSLFGTASFADNATSASYAATASFISGSGGGVGFPFSGSAVITGSLLITELSGSGVRYLTTNNNGLIVAQTASAAIKQTQAFTSSANQTSFTISDGYVTGLVDVFINGSKLAPGVEFTDTSGTVITLATGSSSGDLVEFVKYFPASGVTNNALRQLTTLTGSAGQTVFSASYTPGLLDIFYNGSRLSTSDYTANNGTYFTLATASAADDILDVLVYSYQVGAFNGIGGQGVTNQLAFFNTTSSITGSNSFTVSGNTLVGTASYALNADTLDGAHLSILATTGSNTFTSAQYVSNTSTPIGFTDTASVYTDGGIRATKTSYFSSSVYIGGDLIIFGSQSVNYITSSQLNIADNIITLNTSSPAVRFGGIAVQDSGSLATGLTGSLLWDSQNNHWIYTNPSGSGYSGGMLISGPRNTGSMGDEQGTTLNALMKGMGGDHITSSAIFENGTLTSIYSTMYVSSSGNVGIGTINPRSYKFHLVNSGSNTQFGISNQGTADGDRQLRMGFGGNGANTWAELQGTRLNVADDVNLALQPGGGNVGIGVTSPSTLLHVNTARSSGANVDIMTLSDNVTGVQTSGFGVRILATSNNGQAKSAIAFEADGGTNNDTAIAFYTQNSAAAMPQRLIIDKNGTVRVNTLGGSTNYKFGVSGSAYVNGTNNKGIFITDGASYASIVGLNSAISAYNSIELRASGVDGQLFLSSGGNVGFFTTNPVGSVASNLVHVNGASAVLRVGPNYPAAGAGTDRDFIELIADGANTKLVSPNETFSILNTGGGAGSWAIDIIAGSGGVRLTNGATSWSSISDIRQKDIIEPITDAISKVSTLSTVIYKFKDDETEQRRVGLIAQEVNEVLPEAVNSFEDEEKMWSVRYTEVIPLLTKAIQEQQALITSLQEKLERNNII